MTINNDIATRDLPTHGWKNINSAGAKPHGLVGSEVIRLQAARFYYCRLSYIERHFPQVHEFGHAYQQRTVVSFKVQTTAAASPSLVTH